MDEATRLRVSVLAIVGAVMAACGSGGDGPSAPVAPGGGGGPGGRPSTSRDAATTPPVDGEDAGGSVGPIDPEVEPGECVDVIPGLADDPGALETVVSMPADLVVTRAETTWEGDCDDPVLRVTLSDGRCPSGREHQVVLFFDAKAVMDELVKRGENVIEAEPEDAGLRVRYERPERLDPVAPGVWGTCLGATGRVDLPLGIGLERQDRLTAEFFLQLAPCDEDSVGTQDVVGSFDVTLIRGLDDVCPP